MGKQDILAAVELLLDVWNREIFDCSKVNANV